VVPRSTREYFYRLEKELLTAPASAFQPRRSPIHVVTFYQLTGKDADSYILNYIACVSLISGNMAFFNLDYAHEQGPGAGPFG
jgi:hypothetical protein